MGKSKKLNLILLLVLISFMTVFVTGSVFACNGGGNGGSSGGSSGGDSGGDGGGGYSDSDLPSTGIAFNVKEEGTLDLDEFVNSEGLGARPDGPVHIPSTTWEIEVNQFFLDLFQSAEDLAGVGTLSLGAANYVGGLGLGLVGVVWNGSKYISRELYAIVYRGDADSVVRSNNRSLTGRIANNLAGPVYNSNAVKILMDRPRGDSDPDGRSNRPVGDPIYETDAVKILMDTPRGDALNDD